MGPDRLNYLTEISHPVNSRATSRKKNLSWFWIQITFQAFTQPELTLIGKVLGNLVEWSVCFLQNSEDRVPLILKLQLSIYSLKLPSINLLFLLLPPSLPIISKLWFTSEQETYSKYIPQVFTQQCPRKYQQWRAKKSYIYYWSWMFTSWQNPNPLSNSNQILWNSVLEES